MATMATANTTFRRQANLKSKFAGLIVHTAGGQYCVDAVAITAGTDWIAMVRMLAFIGQKQQAVGQILATHRQ